jgi:glycogen phosphorylase
VKAIRRFTVRTTLPSELEGLGELALNLRWSWQASTRQLFASLDPELWKSLSGDPMRLLGALGSERLADLAHDSAIHEWCAREVSELHAYLQEPRWYQHHGEGQPRAIAYFSAEFGITSVLPQYSGGLGILAGDHLKTASDLGIPLIGVGLLYRSGYFNQSLSRDGWQLESYPVFDPNALPLSLLREVDGSASTISLHLPGRTLEARIWIAQVGRVPLLLLDTNIESNSGSDRDITDRLYGGGHEHRLLQELLLGVGGVRAIRSYCRITGHDEPEVYHANEGHAGFQGIERMRELAESHGLTFDEALEAVRSGTVFTTHTPVPAGIDRFPSDLIAQHFSGEAAFAGLSSAQILGLGAENFDGGDPTVFNMAVMGMRLAQRANGVSKLHGEVSRGMFDGLWPGFDRREVPIASVTNGVHAPTWVAPEVLSLIGHDRSPVDVDQSEVWLAAESLDDARVWEVRNALRSQLVDDIRSRVRESWLQRGAATAELTWTESVFDPEVLTIGFARRVPSYKRLTLMLRDEERLAALLTHPTRPVQIVVAGKSHPADDGGKLLIQQLVQFADRHDLRHRIAFLPNYDIAMAQTLYPGCDVWLNNPLRPLEACGTSGMKAALNGSLNLSILDGWWDELYDGRNGWAIPTADGVDDPDRRDDIESAALYDLIENSVTPKFYDRDHDGVPRRWTSLVKHTWLSLGPEVVGSRMLRDYVDTLYAPSARAARALTRDFTVAKELASWKAKVNGVWAGVRVDHVESTDVGDAPEVGAQFTVRAFISLGALRPEDVRVEVVFGATDSADHIWGASLLEMSLAESYDSGQHRYEALLTLNSSGPCGYTVRVLPHHVALASVAETGLIALPA